MQQIHALTGIFTLVITAVTLFSVIAWSVIKLQKYKREAWAQLSLYAEVTAKEKDRAWIKDQLHEDFAQSLAAVRMFINQFTLREDYDIQLREQTNTYIDDVITKIRGIALEYLPYSIKQGNLQDTLGSYTDYINTHHNDFITLKIEEEIPPLSDQKTINIYRIVQEIIFNTIKHAKATELLITLKLQGDKLLLKTQDNGIGFNYNKELEKEMGLNTMATRIQLLKGQMKVDSGKGGTMYGIEIPL